MPLAQPLPSSMRMFLSLLLAIFEGKCHARNSQLIRDQYQCITIVSYGSMYLRAMTASFTRSFGNVSSNIITNFCITAMNATQVELFPSVPRSLARCLITSLVSPLDHPPPDMVPRVLAGKGDGFNYTVCFAYLPRSGTPWSTWEEMYFSVHIARRNVDLQCKAMSIYL